MTTVQCPNKQCKALCRVPDELLGRTLRCKKCATLFRVSAPANRAPSVPASRASGVPAGAPRSASRPAAPPPVPAPKPAPPLPEPIPLERALAPPGPRRLAVVPVLATSLVLVCLTLVTGSYAAFRWFRVAGPAGVVAGPVAHGGIEIGSKGVKAAVVEVIPDPEHGSDFRILNAGTANTTLSAGLGREGRFDPEALRDTAAAVARFCGLIRDKYQIPDSRIHLVASSGLFSALKGDAAKIEAAHTELARAVREACGLTLDFVNGSQEVELSILGTVPRRYAASSLFLDVGSGNTKGGYREGERGRFVTIEVPFGSVTLAKSAKSGGLDPVVAELRQKLRDQMPRRPGLTNRERVYLSGGAAWALATLTHPANRKTFVKLSAQDVATYRQRLREDSANLLKPDLSALPEEIRKQAEGEVRRIRDVFSPENLQAGAEILQALTDEFHLAEPDKTLYFARCGQFAWLLSYIAREEHAAS